MKKKSIKALYATNITKAWTVSLVLVVLVGVGMATSCKSKQSPPSSPMSNMTTVQPRQTTVQPRPKVAQPMQQNANPGGLPLDKEGWLNRDVFQVVESVPGTGNINDSSVRNALDQRAQRRVAELIILSRYKIYKDEFSYIDKLQAYPRFRSLMQGELISVQQNGNMVRGVYRIQKPSLQRSLKHTMNSFEELNPALRSKIKEGDISY